MLILRESTNHPVYSGSHEKLIYRRELPKKGGTMRVCRFKGGLGKKEGGVFFEGGWG